ncbi:MAG: CPBP family intramembrane metalloprotease [Bacteroidota bacterium]|nr:CPBP family intramembrane metalloprotease [Bacteroidota bacterium]
MVPVIPKKTTLLIGIAILLATQFAFTLFGGSALLYLFNVKEIDATVFAASRVLFWISLVVIFIYARKAEKQKLLAWEERKLQFWEYLVSVMAIFFALIVGLIIIGGLLINFGFEKESPKFLRMLGIFRENHLLIFLTAFTAGIVEELTFRGYLLPRMTILLKNPALAIFISSVLFGLLHFGYGTVMQLVGPFFIGLIFAIYYYNFRNIKVLIFCHIVWDLMAIYLNIWFTK